MAPTTQVPRNQWYVAAYGTEIGEDLFARTICGEPVVFYRDADDEVAALADRCVHRRFPLSQSNKSGDTIVCGYHGFTYDKTGACVAVPGQARIPRTARVKSYPTHEQDSFVWIAVLREPDGRGGSAAVHDKLAEGDELTASAPRNHFPLDVAGRYLFIAGGIGITPILPMIAEAERRGRPWRLVYGGRTRGSMAFLGEVAGYGDRVSVRPQDTTGLLDLAEILGPPETGPGPGIPNTETGPAAGTAVYCCGPAPLLAAAEERCAAWPAGALRTERFTQQENATGNAGAAFEVELASSGTVITVPPGESVLACLRKAGREILSSCEEGTCGTCETGVLAGVPDHRDTVLTQAERDTSDVMMLCVSRARTTRLVLDL
ncbi:MAG: Rieske 2Fe-2S domain-containing protein [Trebonia sp.]